MSNVLKWLRPGLRIKRWIVLIFAGLIFALLAASAVFLFFLRTEPWEWREEGKLVLTATFGFLLAAFCLVTGIYRLMKSMWGLVEQRFGQQGGLVEAAYQRAVQSRGPKVVAIGGGTGLSVVLTGLREQAGYLSAVVAMADDGGSSGKLRRELGLQPPGDLRKCLIAIADQQQLITELLDYRFPEHEVGGHSFGNLFLSALVRLRGDFGAGVREANRLLSARGQVLPSTLNPVFLVATHEDGAQTSGQAEIAKSAKRIRRIELRPEPEPVAQDILHALADADLIVLGPGSLYTSVLPNLLIDGFAQALAEARARKVFVVNCMTYEGETRDYQLPDFLHALDAHTHPHRVYDYVLVNSGAFGVNDGGPEAQPSPEGQEKDSWILQDKVARPVRYDLAQYDNAPFTVLARDVVNPAFPIRHDSLKLARALLEILGR
jgi:uncharacterized cofD-like protein